MRTLGALLLAGLVGCAPAARRVDGEHPANPDATAGRLAGPPAALRPGVAGPIGARPAGASKAADPHAGHGANTPTDPHAGHGVSEDVPGTEEPTQTAKPDAPAPPPSAPKKKPSAKKPPAKKPPAKKPPAKEPAPPTPAPPAHDHSGHHHHGGGS